MNSPAVAPETARRSVLPASTWVLRALVLAGPVVALELGRVAGHRPGLPWLVAVLVLAAASARRPGEWFGTMAAVLVVVWWVQAVRAELPLAVALAAVALATGHVAAVLADLGPPRMALDAAVTATWTVRGAGAVAVAGAVWLLAAAADDVPAPGLWVLALLVLTVAALAVASVLTRSHEE